jgi:beta-galactosidase
MGLILLLAAADNSLCAPDPRSTRTKEALCEAWTFHLGDVEGAEKQDFDDSKWRMLDVPHDWSIELPYDPKMPGGSSVGYLPGGIGWYRKAFALPESDIGKVIVIDFDGVYMDSQVWINGHLLGRRPNGYVGFRYDLTPYLKYGLEKNQIAVRVNVEPNGSRWYPGAGLYRHVWLVKMNPVHVAHWGTTVTTPDVSREKATVRLRTEVENTSGASEEVILTSVIIDPQGTAVATAESRQRVAGGAKHPFDQSFVVTQPQRWSPDTPDLYQVVSTVKADGKTVDMYTTPLGVRTCDFTADRGFSLNGEHVDIKGVCLHHDFGALGTAISPRALERQLEILREMGCNAIRTSHNPREPEFYAMCDRLGFMVMNEAFDVWAQKKLGNDYHQFFKEWHERDLASMIRRDRNHPSVIIWSIGNEMNEQHRETFPGQGGVIAKRLIEICRQHDPSRLVTAACNSSKASERVGITAALDVYGQNYCLDAYPELKGKKPMIGTENATSFMTRDSYSYEIVNDRGIKLGIQNIKNNSECTGYGKFWGNDRSEGTLIAMRKSPWVAGQFAWTGFDYLGECFPFPWPARNGLFGIIDLAGFPKDSYYIYQADWADKPTVHIVPQNWNWPQYNAKPIPVWIYGNSEEVELFLNNRSLGVKRINRAESLHAEWPVNYEPGELKAIGRSNGRAVCTNILRTAGEPVRLEVNADRSEITADGADLSFLEVRLVDAQGVVCRDADRWVRVSVEGAGTLVGIDNGSAMNHAPFKGNQVETFYGLCRVIVKSKREAGTIRLNISADGIEAGKCAVATLPPGDARLIEATMKRDRLARTTTQQYSRHLLAKSQPASSLDHPLPGDAGVTMTGVDKLIVAPVFRHGLGQHADSVIVSRNKKPPTWSEKDARNVIAEEAKRLGVDFVVEGQLPMGFDGVSKTGKIAFEVLTSEDVPDRTDNTDHITDFLGAAQKLVEELRTKPGQNVVGVFYDPLVGKGAVADDEPLRQQVRDFVAWLKQERHLN